VAISLRLSIDSTDRITEAEGKLKAAGIDPKAADAIHQQRMAGMDFKKVLVRSTQPDGSVNVDKLLAQSNNLRYSRYGDRLSQFFGSKDAADAWIQSKEAQKCRGANPRLSCWGMLPTEVGCNFVS
jgi:hypothetical protein